MSSSGVQNDVLAALARSLTDPLVVIANNASLIETQNPETIARVDAIQKTAETVLQQINFVVSGHVVSRNAATASKEPFDIRRIVRAAQADAAAMLDAKSQQFVMKSPRGVPAVVADAELIRRVVLMLIMQASEHAPAETVITVSIRQQENEVQLLIRNQGDGIDTSGVSRAVDAIGVHAQPFPERVSDSGVGLHAAYQIAAAMGGSIRFVPSREGSCFVLSMPINEQLRLL